MFSLIAENHSSKSKGSKKKISAGMSTGAVDPVTGKPYSFLNGGPTVSGKHTVFQGVNQDVNPWAIQGQSFAQGDYDRDSGQAQDQFGHFDRPDYDPNWTRELGYHGSPEGFPEWAKANGYQLALGQMKGGGAQGQDTLRLQIFKDGKPVGSEHRWTKDENDPGFGIGMAVMAAFMGNFAAAQAAGVTASTANPGGVSGMDLAGDAAAGSGNNVTTAAGQFGSSGGGFSAAGANGQLLDPSAYEGVTSGGAVPESAGGVNWGELPTAGDSLSTEQAVGGVGGAGAAGGYATPTNAAQIESSLGTPGYGASSAGAGNPVGSIPSSGSWMDMLQAGDIAGAVKAGGSTVLDFLGSSKGLNLLGGIANGLIGNNATNNALKDQAKARDDENKLLKYMYDTTRGDQATYRATGEVGAAGMRNLLADPTAITKDPSYAFRLTQGQRAIDSSAASKGGLYSGATLKALQRYGQDFGSAELDKAYGRYGDAARLGEAATANVGAAGRDYANGAAGNITGYGNASGAAELNKGNNWMDTINNGLAMLNKSTYQPVPVPGG